MLSKNLFAVAILALCAIAGTSLAPTVMADGPDIEATGTLKDTGVRHVTVDEAKSLVDAHSDIVILDVRTGREFKGGHVEGAVNMNYFSLGFGERVDALDKDKTYLLYCRSGNRSGKAARALRKAGIDSIVHMDGGTNAWSQAGLPLVTEKE
ncbi:MAG: rhodanese-like domain-containing protein [Pseudomonadota bacterium]